MPQNLLEQLRKVTVVVADTGDMEAMEKFHPQDATTNPSLITTVAQMPQYQPIVDDVLTEAHKELGDRASDKDVANLAFKRLAIAFGKKILGIIPGRVSTEVDARLSYDTEKTVDQAREIIGLYKKEGVDPNRVLVKIASTWEGIRAAEVLEKEGIHINMTLLFGLHQAILPLMPAPLSSRPSSAAFSTGTRKTRARTTRAQTTQASSLSLGFITISRNLATKPLSWAPASATSVRFANSLVAICSPSRRSFWMSFNRNRVTCPANLILKKLKPCRSKESTSTMPPSFACTPMIAWQPTN